jgi:hypothetical protein
MDQFGPFKNQARQRLQFYRQEKLRVVMSPLDLRSETGASTVQSWDL